MATEKIEIRPLTKVDYDYIVKVIDDWWGGPTSALAHPVYFYELGDQALVADTQGRLVGFLLGFVAQANGAAGPVGYVHIVGIDPEFRRKRVGAVLYQAFERACREAGCTGMKAITTLGDDGSVRFHEALGWKSERVEDYAGPGRTRIVFTKALA
jgi:GNAT superfamily N-acetyltransferase